MVKTQIQLPEHLYREAKRIAADYEMSFAEVVRRSLERTLPAYPPRTSAEWRLPEPIHLELDPAHIPAMQSDTTDGHDDMAEDTTTARRGDGDGASSPRRHGGGG